MGTIFSKLIGSALGFMPCASFLKDFPRNVPKISLPSVILDGLGITCSGDRSAPVINFAANVASAIGLYVANTQLGFMKTIGNLIPRVFTSNPETNATIFEYLVMNIILFMLDALAGGKSVYDANTPGEAVVNCTSDLIGCTKDLISYIGELKSPTCAKGLDTDAGLCYKPCKPGYHGVGPVCWADNPKPEEGWKYDGVEGAAPFIHNRYARPQHWQVDLPMPPGATRVGVCGASFGPLVTEWNCDSNAKIGDPVPGRPGWTRRTVCTIDKGGVEVNCEKYGQGCEEGYEKHGSMCYEKPKPGYKCDLLNCYKTCPPGWTSTGIGCVITSEGRGVGTVPNQCEKGYKWDGALACGPTDETMRALGHGSGGDGNAWIPWVIGGVAVAAGVGIYAYTK